MNKQKLKELIENTGKTVNQIQVEAGMKTGTLYRILSGERNQMYLSTAFRLADALGVDINEFREEKDQ